MKVFADCQYLDGNNIIKAKTTGNFNSISLGNFQIVGDYRYGDKILNLTHRLKLTSLIYDTYTHEYLGDYLRFYRDYKNVDLMSMYNCFNNQLPNNINFNITNGDNIISIFNSEDAGYKLYAVPIRCFNNYTIGIDCANTIELAAGLYNGRLIKLHDKFTQEMYNKTYQKIAGTSLKRPFLYTKVNNLFQGNLGDTEEYYNQSFNQEINLKLFIKVPANCDCSLVVLEGDFTKTGALMFNEESDSYPIARVSNTPLIVPIESWNKNLKNYPTKLQLLNITSSISYPFADKLVEYLTKFAVDKNENINQNIEKIQDILLEKTANNDLKYNYDIFAGYGIWDASIRNSLYTYITSTDAINSYFDILGYADKDVTESIG